VSGGQHLLTGYIFLKVTGERRWSKVQIKQEIRSLELGVCPMQLFHIWLRDVHPVQKSAAMYKISWKSDDFSLRYGDISIFKMTCPPSWNCFTTIWDHPRSLCCWPQLPVKFHVNTQIGWLRGTVGRTSVFDRRTFHVLRSTCSWWVTTYVGKPSAVGQPTRPTQPFILSG